MNSAHLPLYGTDPIVHTVYVGSDEQYHYFDCQNGKSYTREKVRCDEATIEPHDFPLLSGRRAFVESAGESLIKLMVLE